MKRPFRILLLLLAAVTALSVTASAATVTQVKNIKTPYADCMIYPCSADGTQMTFTTAYVDGADKASCIFTDAEKLELQFTPTDPKGEFVVFLLKAGENEGVSVPTAENIYYLDQKTGTDGLLTFVLYPKDLTAGNYVLYISSAAGYEKMGSFRVIDSYTAASFKLGNVNMDSGNKINSTDVIKMLQHIVGKKVLTGDAFKAADVNSNGVVNSTDAIKVLQYIVGKVIVF